MPRYNLFLYNQYSRVRYPEALDLPDGNAAHRVARKVANVFMEIVPYWKDLSSKQQDAFVAEVVNEVGRLVLTVPFMGAKEAKT